MFTLRSFYAQVRNDPISNEVCLTVQFHLPALHVPVVDEGLCKLHSLLVEKSLTRGINQRTPRRWGYQWIEMHLEMISGAHLEILRSALERL